MAQLSFVAERDDRFARALHDDVSSREFSRLKDALALAGFVLDGDKRLLVGAVLPNDLRVAEDDDPLISCATPAQRRPIDASFCKGDRDGRAASRGMPSRWAVTRVVTEGGGSDARGFAAASEIP